MIVKVCGITRRADAEVAVEAGADALGFIFFSKSPRFVSAADAAKLGEGLQVSKVGIFVNEPASHVEQMMREAKLDVAQLYGGDAPVGARVWRAFRVVEGIDDTAVGDAEAVLLDGAANGIRFDWEQARAWGDRMKKHVIVAGGLNDQNVAEAIRQARPWGVDASSGLEIAPGIKDHDKVRRFIESARAAARVAEQTVK